MSDLHVYARTGNIDGVRDLLRRGADPNIQYCGETPLHSVASMDEKTPKDVENRLKVAEELIKRGADVNRRTKDELTPLMLAVRAVNCSLVELLLDAGADINIKDTESNSAIHHAVYNFHKKLSKVQGLTSSKLEIIDMLLKRKPELDVKNELDKTPLMISVEGGNLPIIQRLLNHGASVNFLDKHGSSVLHYAFYYMMNIDILYELLRYGGDFELKNTNGKTPLDLHFSYGVIVLPNPLKHLLKICILLRKDISNILQEEVSLMTAPESPLYSKFIEECECEIKNMQKYELAPNYCAHNIALRGFLKSAENDPVPDDDVFDKVINKIIEGDYFIYGDLIVNGIRSSYWKKKFAEICSDRTNKAFLIYDELYKLSFYLSRLEMLSLMVACDAKDKWDLTSHIWHTFPPIRHRTMM